MKLRLRHGINKDQRRFGVGITDYNGYLQLEEVYKWCCEQFGDRNDRYNNPRWDANYFKHTYWFKFEKDRDWFVLRWS
jgi:hypothetical protein